MASNIRFGNYSAAELKERAYHLVTLTRTREGVPVGQIWQLPVDLDPYGYWSGTLAEIERAIQVCPYHDQGARAGVAADVLIDKERELRSLGYFQLAQIAASAEEQLAQLAGIGIAPV